MTNKEKLKRVIEQDIDPKSYYKEIIKKIEKKDKIKKNNIWKYSFASLCVIGVISGILFLGSRQPVVEYRNCIDEESNTNLKNEATDKGFTKGDVAGDSVDITFEELIKEEAFVANISLPSLNNSRLMKRYDMDKKFIGYDLIYYSVDDNNEITKQVEIFFSKTLKTKPSCYENVSFAEEEDFKINNTNIKVLKINTNYYYALFSYNNYNFEIDTDNISKQELTDLLNSIID